MNEFKKEIDRMIDEENKYRPVPIVWKYKIRKGIIGFWNWFIGTKWWNGWLVKAIVIATLGFLVWVAQQNIQKKNKEEEKRIEESKPNPI